jgi:hypothetical protein
MKSTRQEVSESAASVAWFRSNTTTMRATPKKNAQFAERLILEENVGLLLGPYGTVATDQVAEIAER